MTNQNENSERTLAEIIGKESIWTVVDDFYNRIQDHTRLAVPFSVIQDWPEHKAHIAHFWWVSMGGLRYRNDTYNVAEKHMAVGFTPDLLADWLALFESTLRERLAEDVANAWLKRARNIGKSLVLMYEHQLRISNRKEQA